MIPRPASLSIRNTRESLRIDKIIERVYTTPRTGAMARGARMTEPEMVLQLRDAIQADGRSLNQLAKDSGLDAGRLSRFLRGERDINFEASARRCDVLGIRFSVPQRATETERYASGLSRSPTAESAAG